MLAVLINAYACAPNRGSEPGMAWNWVINLAKYCKVYVITEGEWKDEIEIALKELPQGENIIFYYNPLSEKIRKMCWNQGDWRFYYYYRKWQKTTLLLAGEILKNNPIDVIHQLNMIGFREPGFLWKIENKPFIWGPIGGMKNFPEAYLENASLKIKLFIKLKNKINIFQIKNDIRVKKALQRANLLVSAIPETQNLILKYYSLKSELITETGCYIKDSDKSNLNRFKDAKTFDILWVGKFDFRKQLGLALKTISNLKQFPGIKFHVVGTGSKEQIKNYKSLANDLELNDIVVWHNAISNTKVLELMEKSHLFFFTSVSEDTSTVVLEALSCNLPVLCFNACGFGPLIDSSVGMKIEFSNINQSINEFGQKIEYLYAHRDILLSLSENCFSRQQELSWDSKAQQMVALYKKSITKF
jgi:glycosyltransferase involved in cell wall biosynthesis